MTMLSVPLAFGLAWRLLESFAGGRLVGSLAAALLVATHPVWLLNGRRVMQEAALGMLSLAVIWLALGCARKTTPLRLAGLALASGLCLAAKPTGTVPVGLAFVASGVGVLRQRPRRRDMFSLTGAGLTAVGLYVLLTPAIWDAPLSRSRLAAELRLEVLRGQTAASDDAYGSAVERWTALVNQPFLSHLQYYESPAFAGALDAEIASYESERLDGWRMAQGIGWLWTGLAALGLLALLRCWREPTALIGSVWAIGTALALGASVPLAWQRYYLLWTLTCCVLAGIGMGVLARWMRMIFNRRVRSSELTDTHG
jgi:hypothetical protein